MNRLYLAYSDRGRVLYVWAMDGYQAAEQVARYYSPGEAVENVAQVSDLSPVMVFERRPA